MQSLKTTHSSGTFRAQQRPLTSARLASPRLHAIREDHSGSFNVQTVPYKTHYDGSTNATDVLREGHVNSGRRGTLLLLAASAATASAGIRPGAAIADDFVTLPSGLKILTIREGEGAQPRPGDTVEVHWAGFTKGYQGKRIDNTSVRDEPYEFKLGGGQAIKAFEIAVQNMKAGGITRVEVPGERPELGYPLDRGDRFTGDLISPDLKIYKYRYGPQPAELGGQRALDFVLDNRTLKDFNRTLLFDIKLLAVRRPRA